VSAAAQDPAPPPRADRIGSTGWVITLGAATAITAMSTDMSLPAQPTLARAFAVSADAAQLTLSLFLIAFAVTQIFVGYLSDVLGRRPVMIGGLAVYVAASVGCAVSPSFGVLVACRVLQGMGAASGPVIARAMVRDTQHSNDVARVMSSMLATLQIAPMIAPAIGGALLGALGWRAIFVALAGFGIAILVVGYRGLPETLPVARRAGVSPRGLMGNLHRFFATPGTRLPLLIGCASFAGQFAYIAASPFVLMTGYGVSKAAYSGYFAATAFAVMVGSLVGARRLRAGRTPVQMIVQGTGLLMAGGCLVLIGTRIAGLGIAGFVIPMLIYFFGVGVASPCAGALALMPVREIAGTASAAIGVSVMSAGAVSSYVTIKLGGSSPAVFGVVVGAMGTIAAILAWRIARGAR
jgi:DHA1 family bicyclomycin/chloramphenicol resistance-like MFS transporter